MWRCRGCIGCQGFCFSSGLLHFQNHQCEIVGLGVTVCEGDYGFEDMVV